MPAPSSSRASTVARPFPVAPPQRALLHSPGVARAGWADVSPSCCCSSTAVQLRRVPVPARSDHPGVIILALCWYLRYSLSYRDVEELLAERGVAVDHVTILPVGAAVPPGVDRRSLAEPARRRGSLVSGRDVSEGRWAVGVAVPGDRPAWAGH